MKYLHMENSNRCNSECLIAALEHAREMANFASEVRMKNFNFFIVIVGALVTGHICVEKDYVPFVLGFVGVLTSIFFLFLDIRARELLKRSIDQLDLIEPKIWKLANLEGWSGNIRSGPIRIISHKWIYRSFFTLTGICSLAILILEILNIDSHH